MRKATTTEEARKQIDTRFKPVVRNGQVCLLELDENGEPLNYNDVVKKEK